MTTGKLAGKVAIVTGGGNGLGAECARVLGLHGASVAVAEDLAARLRARGIAVTTGHRDIAR